MLRTRERCLGALRNTVHHMFSCLHLSVSGARFVRVFLPFRLFYDKVSLRSMAPSSTTGIVSRSCLSTRTGTPSLLPIRTSYLPKHAFLHRRPLLSTAFSSCSCFSQIWATVLSPSNDTSRRGHPPSFSWHVPFLPNVIFLSPPFGRIVLIEEVVLSLSATPTR